MRKKIATTIRKEAEKRTIGMSVSITRRLYRKMKKKFKDDHKPVVLTKLRLSKRAQRRLVFNHS